MKLSNWLSLSGIFVSVFAGLAQPAWCINLEVAEAPTNDLALTVDAIQSARKTLLLNIYELSSPDVADALINRIQAGVQVKIIEEGQPVGGMSTASKGIVSELVQAMNNAGNGDFLLEMSSKAGGKRRFHYDHAKYAVIDGASLLIGSENYSPTGNPESGTVGNRGWEVFIHDANLANSFSKIFISDSDLSHDDLIDMTSQNALAGHRKPKPDPIGSSPQPVPGATTLTANAVEEFTAPNTSLSGLTTVLRGATKSIDIEQMSFYPDWGQDNPTSPLLTEVLAAAKRGVKVRVLLNDETVFDTSSRPSKPHNRITLQQINDAASSEGLPIQAVIANLKAMGVDYIHNKGVVIDGNKTLISSINWDENAVEKNREAAVLITSAEVYNHYEALFEQDWNASSGSLDSESKRRRTTEDFSTRPATTFDLTMPIELSTCPSSVTVDVRVGEITVLDTQDESFAALSNQHMAMTMTRDRSNRNCIFMTSDRTSKKRVLEIRKDSHGNYVALLEGYTANGKLYSIRAKSPSEISSGEPLSGFVYDGSGPGHEKLGDAELIVITK